MTPLRTLLPIIFAAILAMPAPVLATHDDSDGGDAGATVPIAKDEKSAPNEADATAGIAEDRPQSLTVASWGGAYGESQKRAYFAPFKNKTGIAIEMVSHNGKFASLSGEAGSDAPDWDIVDLGPDVLEEACRNGKLERVDASALAAAKDGTPATDDFLPGVMHQCGVPSVAWSSAIVFDKRAFKKSAPKTARDFFDPKAFPGARAIPRDPKYLFELALMADGVEPDKVYDTLSTSQGVDRAVAQLDKIRNDIVWWNKAHEPLSLLVKQKATMGLAFNGRIFTSIVAENRPFGIIWDGQIYDLDFWAIPKGAKHKKSSLEFITFATRPDRMAYQARWFPYGPVRKSALDLVGKHPEVEVDMSAFIPTSDANFKRALRIDASWWRENAERMSVRFKSWMIGDGGSAETGADAEMENRR
jgi:putative spermidine/putrescine transport system substrate-binding protein